MRKAISCRKHLSYKMPPNTACSVHPNPGNVRRGWRGGSLRVFRQFAWLQVDSDKMAWSRPAHQYP
jgi:hypothetical protein